MISSSPSPTLHSTSPHHAAHGSFARPRPSPRPSPSSSIPSTHNRAGQPSLPKIDIATPRTRTLKEPVKATRDAATQYSPPGEALANTSPTKGKRKDRPASPKDATKEPTTSPKETVQRAESHAADMPARGPSSSASMANSSESSSSKRPRPEAQARTVMPTSYETCNVRDLVQLIAAMLMELIRFNDDIPLQDGRLTRFHSRAPPGISVGDYLQRLTTHATLSPPILLSMVYYIDRLCVLYPQFTISSLTVHRYLIASATVASKGLSDSFWTNNTYARVGGVSLKELALLELEFLWRLEWRIVPKPEVLVDYYRSLVERNDGFEMEEAAAEPVPSSL